MAAESHVVVVGAGIGGAVLALALGKRGWKVTLLERESEPPRAIRPEILWGPTPAALDPLGVGDAIRRRTGIRVLGIEARQGGRRRLRVSRSVLDVAGAEPYSTDPGLTRAAIADAALATGTVTVLRGATVTECLFDGRRIVGVRGTRLGQPFEATAPLIVGDDGAHSVVRTALKLPIDLRLFPLDFITAPLLWRSDLPAAEARIWFDPAAKADEIPAVGCIPWPRGEGVLLLPLSHDRIEPLLAGSADAFWSKLAKVTPLAERLAKELRFPGDFTHVRRPFGHAVTYVADGGAIVGDAAHPMSPVGGQGANASIWDALALADVAHEALAAGDVSRQRLLRYEKLRHSRNAASVRLSRVAARAVAILPWIPARARLIPALLGILDALPAMKGQVLASIARTFVTR